MKEQRAVPELVGGRSIRKILAERAEGYCEESPCQEGIPPPLEAVEQKLLTLRGSLAGLPVRGQRLDEMPMKVKQI